MGYSRKDLLIMALEEDNKLAKKSLTVHNVNMKKVEKSMGKIFRNLKY